MRSRIPAILIAIVLLLGLSACASSPQVYEVRFELNGGTLVSGQVFQRIAAGGAAEAPSVEREGFLFEGWSEALEPITANTVAVANWVRAEAEPAVYEVRFELNGGTLVSGQVFQRVAEGGAAEAPSVEREGFLFDGWSEALEPITADTVAVANWLRAEAEPAVYEVRFELNGGSFVSGHLLQQVTEGGAAEAPIVEREGYAFAGWSEALEPITGNTVAAALWESYCQLRFDAAGGSVVSGESEQLVRKGETPVPPTVERAYFSFDGWDPEPGAAQGDTVYTARWRARKLSSEEIFSKISPAVVEITAYEPSGQYYSIGSGFFIDGSGRLVTNYHVIDGTVSGEVTLSDGSRRDILAVLDYDKALDLALLQIDIADNPCLTVSAQKVTTGEAIYALGSSQGLTSTFSSGIVSTASREIDGVRFIQTTAPISEGNSGGPLVDPYGEVVGVNSMTLVTGQNLNFAIDIHELDKLTPDKSLTLAEVYALEYPDGESSREEPEELGFYADTERAEEESNDIFLLSDKLASGEWIAGEVADVDDLDWFYLEIDAPCDVNFEVVPYYTDDMDYLLCGILSLTEDDDVELMDALTPTEMGDYEAQVGTIHFDAAGSYFLLLCLSEEYPYTDPAFYVVRAVW